MEGIQYHYPRSCYQHDVNARSMKGNNMRVGMSNNTSWNRPSMSSYEPSREGCVDVVPKPKKTGWWNDPERKRKRRVAKYKFYAAEGRFKQSVKKGLRWFKIKCIKIVTNL